MKRKELIAIGDASVRRALADMYAILDGNGGILSRIGGDRMVFSPRLECGKDCSAVLFDGEDKARGAIENILEPQDDGCGYSVFRFSSLGDVPCGCRCGEDGSGFEDCCMEDDFGCGEDGQSSGDSDVIGDFDDSQTCGDSDDEDDSEVDIVPAGDDGAGLEVVVVSGDEDGDSESSDIDAEIDKAAAAGDFGLVSMLEELKSLREEGGTRQDGLEDEETVIESAGKVPTMREAHKVLKRNGFQLVSQRGSHQKWVKEGDRTPIILPYHSRDNEQVQPVLWRSIVKEHNLDLDV